MHGAYNKTYNFNKETHLGDFANRIYDEELSFNEARDEQKDFLKDTDELDDRIEPEKRRGPSKKKKKETMKEVVKNARAL